MNVRAPGTTSDEVWRVVEGTGGDYEVSDQGRIRSWLWWKRHPWDKQEPRIINGTNSNGYRIVKINWENGESKFVCVHRLVAEAFLSEHDEDCTEVNHINHVRDDNRVGNLEWMTVAQNRKNRAKPRKNGWDNMSTKIATLEREVAELRAVLVSAGLVQ